MMPPDSTKTLNPMEQFKAALSGLSQVPTPLDDADDENPVEEDDPNGS
jgi:hypothetical protein|tara:strand:+ start:63 stop:206 length:144 start_codon:yes stop_codon:yes gene_type:complete